MGKRGRKSAFDERIKPNLEKIKDWAKDGCTDAEIAKKLGVAKSTYFKYKAENAELMDTVKTGREEAVDKLEHAMFDSAIGGKQTIKKAMKVRRVIYENGKKSEEFETMVPYEEEVYIPPNTTAGIFLLKHWGKERGYTNDPLTLALKKEELELKKEIAENNNW